jgi:hypothetical protein
MYLRRSERQFLLDERNKLIYCPIPKVACSSLKMWLLRNTGVEQSLELTAVHDYASRRLRLRHLGWREARRRLEDPSYFKFVFVRSPFSRLVSAFLDKVRMANHIALDILWQVQNAESPIRPYLDLLTRHARCRVCGWLAPDVQRGITFREFVEYLQGQNLKRVDAHWRPQNTFLGPTRFDFVGRFEHLRQDLNRICKLKQLPFDLPHRNRTRYEHAAEGTTYADWTAEQLNQLDAMPGYRQFYTPELVELVARLYGEDLERFGYSARIAA